MLNIEIGPVIIVSAVVELAERGCERAVRGNFICIENSSSREIIPVVRKHNACFA